MLPTTSILTDHLHRTMLPFLLKAKLTIILVQLKSNQDLNPCLETKIKASRLKFQQLGQDPSHEALGSKFHP